MPESYWKKKKKGETKLFPLLFSQDDAPEPLSVPPQAVIIYPIPTPN